MTLPTPRALLTSIFTTLTKSPTSYQHSTSKTTPSNPFNSLPNSYRALLATLHVILPSPMLLQAFDLLDRGLVTRISVISQNDAKQQQGVSKVDFIYQNPTFDSASSVGHTVCLRRDEREKSRSDLYQVRSSHSAKINGSRRQNTSTLSSMVYTVYLDAWNCSCATFVFSAFPIPELDDSRWSNIRRTNERDKPETMEWDDGESKFGGARLEYDEMEGMPVCKHLLACLFARNWESSLGIYVKHRWVLRDEIAAVIFEI
ncbi:putative ubiquitin carboxyl-terminal hydrolase family protein [Golovinomyces cichoracearum]|uniref:Putative ubiquitin carboxyl-terminal hydrolase family protein n=1 Tax=Golovinomyces cichoracearum TaxID=62708 RepID=A0A420IFT4_9PEZI|nr:putative ubiquitin carboxyl-terminal hydrolase family protein [Golovinomyces cichoracearum]